MAYSEPRGVLLRIMATGETHLLPDTANMVVLGWRSDGASIRARRELSSTEQEYWDLSDARRTAARDGRRSLAGRQARGHDRRPESRR